MVNIDQYQSVFRSADKEAFQYQSIEIRLVLVVTDLEREQADSFCKRMQGFLKMLDSDSSVNWRRVDGSDFRSAEELLKRVADEKPDLICTYRNLHSEAWKYPYSLGEYLDVLTQHTAFPVLVAPHPKAAYAYDHALEDTNRVMAVTNHLTGDHRLVNYAVRFTQGNGTLYLAHVEDEAAFEHIMKAISKIPSIDTQDARESLNRQLLKEPHDYIRSCGEFLVAASVPVILEEVLAFGHRLSEYKKLIEKHEVDLLVFNTREEDQLAMHGLAYSLAVELRQIPLLML